VLCQRRLKRYSGGRIRRGACGPRPRGAKGNQTNPAGLKKERKGLGKKHLSSKGVGGGGGRENLEENDRGEGEKKDPS